MSTAALKRELALLRSSLAALTPAEFAVLDNPFAWAERTSELTLDSWKCDVLLSAAPRLLLNATRQSGKSTVAALKAAWTVLQGGLAVVVSPSLRQSGFLFRKLARHLVASEASFRRETMTEVELASGGLAVSLPGDRPAMLRGLSLRHEGPAVLIVDEASRVRDELWATISPMLAAAPPRSRSCSRPRPAPAVSFTAPGLRAKTGSVCKLPPINARAFLLNILPPSASALAMLSTGRSTSARLSQRRAASSTPRCWRTCSAITPTTSPTSRLPLCMGGPPIASCSDPQFLSRIEWERCYMAGGSSWPRNSR